VAVAPVLVVLVTAALFAAQPAAADPKLFVGVAEDGLKYEPQAAVAAARRIGIGAFRITLLWSPGQTRPTRAQAGQLDRALRAARGLRVVVAVYADEAAKAPTTRRRRREYCRFLRSVVARRPRLKDVVVWNEPNKSFFWRPQFGPGRVSAAPAAYEALLARCWDVLHGARPEINVVAPATSPRGNDDPDAPSDVSHSPGSFIRKLGKAYRRSGRDRPIFDTVGHHVHGVDAREPPGEAHAGTMIGEGDLDRLLAALSDGFGGTAQPVPGRCVRGRCISIWYLEAGYQTRPDARKRSLYLGAENDARPIPDAVPAPAVPDQAGQISAALELAFCQPHVGAFFNFLLWDEQRLEGWQSAPYWFDRTPKHSFDAFKRAIQDVNDRRIDCEPDEPEASARAREHETEPAAPPPRNPFRATPTTTARPQAGRTVARKPKPAPARTVTAAAPARARGRDSGSPVLPLVLAATLAAALAGALLLRRRRSR
jgi:hypothetical protein